MLIWINGAFGAGKTLIAHELQRRVRDGYVADPELVGRALQRMVSSGAGRDFQDLPQWRSATAATLLQAEAVCDGPLIVPMTLIRDDYFDELIGGLRSRGVEVRHYALLATPETLRRRLRRRGGYGLGRALGRPETWAMTQIDRCVSALAGERFATHIATDDRSVDEVVALIAADAGVELIRPPQPAARQRLQRLQITARHIRF